MPCSARCWLIWKTEGGVQADARRYARWLLPAFLLMVGAVSLATPFLEAQYHQRWFEWPGLLADDAHAAACSAASR